MPRRRKPPRIAWRTERGRPGEAEYRVGSWVIRDGSHEKRLALEEDQREDADLQLALYIQEKRRSGIAEGLNPPERMLISGALAFYQEEHVPYTADPARIRYAIKALLTFWSDMSVSEITKKTCRRYAEFREVSPGTVRNELGKLRAALNFCKSEGRLAWVPHVLLPPRPPARERWLTRSETARLVRAARRSSRTRHLVRFILIGVYTGTRSGPVRRLRWTASLGGGHVDLEQGVLYRRSAQTAETKKQQPAARLPKRLLRLLKIWRRQDERFCQARAMTLDLLPIIHFHGKPIEKFRKSWRSVCELAGLDGDVVAHSLRHTAITWAAQASADPWEMCGFFGISMEELQRTYLHHHPDHQDSVIRAFDHR